ncbi:Transmembrane protein [Trema orientale]|uniref:Transmembrane protein n=1 Tax=Trema orientale TaxID=63057 RepID=A0A2P5EZP1_TREOI|nr:Transmembrane protein [Trema orientale]
MPTTASSVEHALCVIVVIIIMTLLSTTAAAPKPSLLPVKHAPSPSSVSLQPIEKPLQRDEEEHNHFPPEFIQDYGFWNPTPYFGGGHAAPIPHSHAVEETCCDSSMPNSFTTDKNNMAPEERS